MSYSEWANNLRLQAVLVLLLTGLGGQSFELLACEDPGHIHHPEGEISRVELETIRDQVLKRCGLSAKLDENKLPWYFHYEYGVELINRGRAEYAVEPLQMSANLKVKPGRGVRMYGMWFIDYIPYYQISLAYAESGDWGNAWNAIVLSETLVEFSPEDEGYDDFMSLKNHIADHLDITG